MKNLFLVNYYGSKSQKDLNSAIIELFDYKDCFRYIEAFAGAANTLLNKPTHGIEELYEANFSMAMLLRVLTNMDKTMQLINKLHSMEPDEETFNRCKIKKKKVDETVGENILNDIDDILKAIDGLTEKKYKLKKRFDKEFIEVFNRIADGEKVDRMIFKEIEQIAQETDKDGLVYRDRFNCENKISIERLCNGLQNVRICFGYICTKEDIYNINEYNYDIKQELQMYIEEKWGNEFLYSNNLTYEKIRDKIRKLKLHNIKKDFIKKIEQAIDESGTDKEKYDDDIEVAANAYVTFSLSRDGSGKNFSTDENRRKLFHKRVNNLYDVAIRMKDVIVHHGSCEEFLESLNIDESYNYLYVKYDEFKAIHDNFTPEQLYEYVKSCEESDRKDEKYKHLFGEKSVKWSNKKTVVYMDPPYISQENEEDERTSRKSSCVPGSIYQKGWERIDHIDFLRQIRNTKGKCKLIVSNYDDSFHLYDTYLTKELGWNKKVVKVTTRMSNNPLKNTRNECIWYNFDID